VAGYGGAPNRVGNANPGQARQIKYHNCNGGQDNVVDADVDEQPVQDLALNVDNVFQADDCDAFDYDVDEAPTAQTMFMANLSFANPIYDEASPSYDSDILSEVPDHDNYQDAVYTSDSNMIPYDQYVKDNAMPVVQSNVSYVPNEAYMMILNDIYESSTQYVSITTQNNVVDKSLTVELATYKEQVKLYKRQAKCQDIVKISWDTLEIAEITRKKMNEKMKDPEWERGFEKTKECYLTEVIPFFKTLKEQFEGIQKILTKEVKEMKEIFEELEDEVDQNVVNRKYDEIERKNLLIANDNLIADCLSKDVFYIATNSELTCHTPKFTAAEDLIWDCNFMA
ncbi:hypothetical protein Tco_1001606, partial [Tanacetum coccineum]